jgi:hypothetical protein
MAAALLCCAALAQNAPQGPRWRYEGVRSGVTTYSKPSPSGHLIFHGAVYAKGVHISELLGECLDDSRATEWVDKLSEIKSAKWKGHAARAPWGSRVYEDVSFQVFEAPWPVSDREMLMHRQTWLTPANRTARITFEPIVGGLPEFPEGRGRVRGSALRGGVGMHPCTPCTPCIDAPKHAEAARGLPRGCTRCARTCVSCAALAASSSGVGGNFTGAGFAAVGAAAGGGGAGQLVAP